VALTFRGAAVFVADALLLLSLVGVLLDQQWRTGYASSSLRYVPSYSYSIFTRYFTMAGPQGRLVSPPTLDWVQLIVAGLLVVNAWYAYVLIRERGRRAPVPRRTTEPS
jgi:hypothetical protein